MRDALGAVAFRHVALFRRSPVDGVSMMLRALVGGLIVHWFAQTYASGQDRDFVVASYVVFMWMSNIIIGTSFEVADDLRTSAFLSVMMARFDAFWYFFAQGLVQAVTWTVQATALAIGLLLPSAGWLGLVRFLGAAGICFVGVFGVAAVLALWTTRHRWFYYTSTVAGSLLTFAGALYPLSVFPEPLRVVCLANPFTYYVDLMRVQLTGDPTLLPSGAQLAVAVLTGTALLVLGVVACRRLSTDVELRT